MNELIHDGTPVTGNAGQCASIRSQHFGGAMLPFWDTRNRPLLEAKNEVLCGRHVPARLGHHRFRAASRLRCDLDPYSTIPASLLLLEEPLPSLTTKFGPPNG